MRRYVLSEDTIIVENQRVTTVHPLFDAVGIEPTFLNIINQLTTFKISSNKRAPLLHLLYWGRGFSSAKSLDMSDSLFILNSRKRHTVERGDLL